jgi:cytoskeleton protein RodZ
MLIPMLGHYMDHRLPLKIHSDPASVAAPTSGVFSLENQEVIGGLTLPAKTQNGAEAVPELPAALLRQGGLRRQAVGDLLRETREKFGQSLPAVSDQLRIRIGYLQAIEESRYADLPGNAYAAGFVRTYAEFLGLDPDTTVQKFRAETSRLNNQQQLVFPTLATEPRFPGGAVLFLSVLLAAAVYGGWYYLSSRVESDLDPVAEVPAELAQSAGGAGTAAGEAIEVEGPIPVWAAAGPASVGTAPDDALAAGSSSGTEELEDPALVPVPLSESGHAMVIPAPKPAISPPAASTAAAGSTDEVEVATVEPVVLEAAPPTPEEPAAALVSGLPAQAAPASRIILQADIESWVQVKAADGSTIMSRVLRAGENYSVPDQPGITLITGNAGGLAVYVDGRRIAPLGPLGVVRRDVPLDPDKLLGRSLLAQ